jgi:hypothetical protein
VTSHKDQIQALINEIDSVLDKPSPRLLSAMAGGGDQQRLVLEQTRSYLASLQRDMAASESPGLAAGISISPFQEQSAAESAQQVLQAVLQEMSYLRTNFMQPLRHDVEELQQQREALTQEIRLLESQRQQYLLPQQSMNQQQLINDFLQSLMGRLQEQLTGQVAQMLTGIEAQTLQERSLLSGATDADVVATDLSHPYQPVLTPRQRLEQVQILQAQSDQLLLKLDSTLSVIFESLQSNIQSYQESLTQGLDKMHSLGQQGEAMFSALVNRLAQQLGREASTYLQSSLETTNWEATQSPLPATYTPQVSVGTAFPGEVPLPPVTEEISDEQIDLLLNELTVGEPSTIIQSPDEEIDLSATSELPFSVDSLGPELETTDVGVDSENFDLSNLELMQLPPVETGGVDEDDDITFFQVDQPLTTFQLEDDDFARLQNDLNLATSQDIDTVPTTADDINDIDSALDLLTQLSAELQTEPAEPSPTQDVAINEAAIAPSLERYDDEMTDLYQSLFGVDAEGFSETLPDDLTDQHIADANLAAVSPVEAAPSEYSDDEVSAMAATTLGDELFGGLADPAQSEEAIVPTGDTPMELDDLDADLSESLFAEAEDIPVETQPAGIGDIDAIASLADLIESPLPNVDTNLVEVLYEESAAEPSEDTFIPAAPDEVLLVTEDTGTETRRDISLDADTINQLTADLSSLEGIETSPVSYEDADLELTEGAWTLEDLSQQLDDYSQPEQPAAAELESMDIEPVPFESVSLEDDITELMEPASLPEVPYEPISDTSESAAPSTENLFPDFLPSPIDHPIPFDFYESSEITEIIEPSVVEPGVEAIAPPPSESLVDTTEMPFSFDEQDDLELDTPPSDLDELFEQLASTSDPYSDSSPSNEPTSTELASAVELTPDELVAPLEFDQSDSLDASLEPLTPLPLAEPDLSSASSLEEDAEERALEDLFSALETDAPASSSVVDEPSGMTLGEFGASLDSLPVEDDEEALLEGLFSEKAVPPLQPINQLADLAEPAEPTPSTPSLEEFSEALPLPLMPPVPDTPPVSAALNVSDIAAPPPPLPLDDEATIEDFFAAANPVEPTLDEPPAEPSPFDSFAATEPFAAPVPSAAIYEDDEINAFTLEGMVDLFEDAPSIEPSPRPEANNLQSSEEDIEKKKTLTPEPSTDVEDADVSGLDWVERLAATQPPDTPSNVEANDAIAETETWLTSLGLDPFAATEPPVTPPPAEAHSTEPSLFETPEASVTDSLAVELDAVELLDPFPPASSIAEPPVTELSAMEQPITDETLPEAFAMELPSGPGSTEPVVAEPPLEPISIEALLSVEAPEAELDLAAEPELPTPEVTSVEPALADLLFDEFDEFDESAAAASPTIAPPPQEDLDEGLPDISDRPVVTDSASEMLAVSEELGIDPRELEALLDSDFATDDFFPPLPPPPPDTFPKVWYLGLDLGTTGISAVLLNRLSGELHPIYWSYTNPSVLEQNSPGNETLFRLPTRVYLSTNEQAIDPADVASGFATPDFMPQSNLVHVSFVPPATRRVGEGTATGASETLSSDFLLHDFKPYLKLGIPYYSPETSCWEPVLQWSDHHQISLSPVHQALRVLLTTLSHTPTAPTASGTPYCGAIGLEEGTLQAALSQLAGVIVGCPVNWPDTYRFNVREAVLGAHLVAHPDQIFVVEDVIATLLSGLRSADGRLLVLPSGLAQKPNLHNADWHGSTLVVNAGATVTDLTLVDLPEQLANLSYQDFQLRSLPVAGNTIDQDIICQLIYPAWLDQADPAAEEGDNSSTLSYTFGAENGAKPEPSDRHAHSSYTPDRPGAADLNQLGLSNLPLPLPGEPDLQTRFRLQQRLESSALGQALLEAARYVKLNLQQQDQLMLRFGDRHFIISRQDLGSRVFLPFIQRLNREINALLSQTSVSALTVNQVICTGGTASLGAIARWLREKFPNATIIQDTYSGNRASSPQDNCLPTCSRVAYGLATLPLHPQVLDLARQQYSDYFLLLEVLRTFPDEPISISDILQRLARRGINTDACYTHILALLEGHLPPGLVPTAKDAYLLTPESSQNPDYRALLAAPLFHKQNDQTYLPNYEQWNHFRRYLSTIMTSTYQKLTEPLSVSLVL